jgi:ABC-type multidrug transport system fused ATPase/permease subunit
MSKRKREELPEEDRKKLNGTNLKKFLGIFQFALPYKWVFATGLIALGLSSITLLSFPYFAGQLLDIASGKKVNYFSSLNEVAVVLVLILFVQSIFSFVRVYTFSIVSEKTLADVRRKLYEKIVWLPMQFFDLNRVGELMSRITSDVSTLQETFTTTLAELLRQIMTLVLGTSLIFYLAPRLTVFMLATVPVLVILALIFGKFIRKLSRNTQDALAHANIVVEESLQGIAMVKAFTNEVLEIIRYSKSLKEVVRVAIHSARYRGLFISFIIFALFGGIVAISWYGATLVQSGYITVGELFSFVLYTTFIGGSMAGLGDIYTQLQRSIGASERILELLDQVDETSEFGEGRKPIKISGEIRFENVSFAYPARPEFTVLNDLNFSINAGEKVALVGQSGSGKSTIINLLMRFYPVKHGSILVDDIVVRQYGLTAYRQWLGIVPQDIILFGGTIFENIAFGKSGATEEEVYSAALQANAIEFIERFPEKFETRIGDRGIKLSGGQRQRLAIARAILKDPAILILDEATSSLDAQSERLVQDALEKLMTGRTTIIIAHRLSTIRKVDRIFVISNGMLVETGSHKELVSLNDGIYKKLLKLQLQ